MAIDSQATLIFLHIPKTAGTTLHAIIERQYRRDAIYTVPRDRHRERAGAFQKLPESKRAKIRVVKGHMGFFGWHEFLPGPSTYMTMLRNPVERVVSHFHHLARSTGHRHHERIVSEKMTLEDYVRSGLSNVMDNHQTRIIGGVRAPIGGCTREHLEMAKANIREHFAVVGLSERFDESLILLKRRFGWRMPFYGKRNVARNRPPRKALPASTRELIEGTNALDVELYRFAGELLDEQIRAEGASFERELRNFRFWNRPYSAIYTRALAIKARVGAGKR